MKKRFAVHERRAATLPAAAGAAGDATMAGFFKFNNG
jgi:hypothetical protein